MPPGQKTVSESEKVMGMAKEFENTEFMKATSHACFKLTIGVIS
jgi:hypothetical protein